MRVFPLNPSRYRSKIVRALSRVDSTVRAAVERGAIQKGSELGQLLHLLRSIPLSCVVEIGTHRGGTLYAWCRASSPSALIVSIDLPGGKFGGGYDEEGVETMRTYARAQQQAHLLRADSHDPQTLNRLRAILDDRAIDFLMIDGDHTYSGVKSDFEDYGPLVRSGGLVAFHDIAPGPAENVGGVPDFWREVKSRFDHEEFVEDWKQGGFGIGVIRMP